MNSQKNLLRQYLSSRVSLDLSSNLTDHACVAVILHGNSEKNLELAFIQRAVQPNDRWSGQIAFPGGRAEDSDQNDIHTACRETWEEVGIQLSPSDQLGRLDDIQGRKAGELLKFYIRPMVFFLDQKTQVNLQENEVADFFWIPISHLTDPINQTVYTQQKELLNIELPSISLGRNVPLWGLTYLMVQDLLSRLKTNSIK